MRIVHLLPGTGNFHCGSCLRDDALMRALRGRGHEATVVPLYLPLVTEDGEEEGEGGVVAPLKVGGISLYLQQKWSGFARLPRWVHRAVDHPALLKLAVERMHMTRASDLGSMTAECLKGLEGKQGEEWGRLIDWVGEELKPEVVSISNGLLAGLVRPIQERLGVPVVVSLQGEDAFLDTLPEPWRGESWALLRQAAERADGLVGVSRYYGEMMAGRMGVESGRVSVVPNGLDLRRYVPSERAVGAGAPSVGYLARMCHGKGLGTLVDAFIELAGREGVAKDLRLRVGGAKTSGDEGYLKELRGRLQAAGLEGRVDWCPNLSTEEKIRFLQGLTVFSVPAGYGEAFGLYVIEAMACGVPVVQPEHGGFPEILERAPGGVLCAADDPVALADALEGLLADAGRREELGRAGREAVLEYYTAARMAEDFEGVLVRARSRRGR